MNDSDEINECRGHIVEEWVENVCDTNTGEQKGRQKAVVGGG